MYITKRDDVKAHTHRQNIRKGEMKRANPNVYVYVVIVNNIKLMSKDYTNIVNSMFVQSSCLTYSVCTD